jgi:hypothetical protein
MIVGGALPALLGMRCPTNAAVALRRSGPSPQWPRSLRDRRLVGRPWAAFSFARVVWVMNRHVPGWAAVCEALTRCYWPGRMSHSASNPSPSEVTWDSLPRKCCDLQVPACGCRRRVFLKYTALILPHSRYLFPLPLPVPFDVTPNRGVASILCCFLSIYPSLDTKYHSYFEMTFLERT